jgi:hypothetical protein
LFCLGFSSEFLAGQVFTPGKAKPLVEGIAKIGPALSYRLVHPYFGNALDLWLLPYTYTIEEKKNSEQ